MQVATKRNCKVQQGQQDRILSDKLNVRVCLRFCCILAVTHRAWHLIPRWSPRHEVSQLFLLCCFQNTTRQFLCVFNNAAPDIKLIFVLFPENAGAVDKAVADVGKRCRVHENGKNCRCHTMLVACFPSSRIWALLIPKIFFFCFTKMFQKCDCDYFLWNW